MEKGSSNIFCVSRTAVGIIVVFCRRPCGRGSKSKKKVGHLLLGENYIVAKLDPALSHVEKVTFEAAQNLMMSLPPKQTETNDGEL